MHAPAVPVSRRALIQRINRALSKSDEALRSNRSERWQRDLGDYYVVDLARNTTTATHVDLEVLARELGLIKSWETLTED